MTCCPAATWANDLYFNLTALAYNLYALLRDTLSGTLSRRRATTMRRLLYFLPAKVVKTGPGGHQAASHAPRTVGARGQVDARGCHGAARLANPTRHGRTRPTGMMPVGRGDLATKRQHPDSGQMPSVARTLCHK